eukprot:365763-Chlamydomonas_euryale.AAC.29
MACGAGTTVFWQLRHGALAHGQARLGVGCTSRKPPCRTAAAALLGHLWCPNLISPRRNRTQVPCNAKLFV